MRPILFHFTLQGNLISIRSYTFFLFLSALWVIILGALLLKHHLATGKLNLRKTKNTSFFIPCVSFLFPLALLISGFFGARLLHIFLNRAWYLADYSRFLAFSPTGFSIYGGILGAFLGGLFLSLLFHWDLFYLGDLLLPVFLGAAILSRIGCFLNGCCYGLATQLPWAMTFSPGSPAFSYEMLLGYENAAGDFFSLTLPSLHPTQLYEIIGLCSAYAVSIYLAKKKCLSAVGTKALFFFLIYSLFRLLNTYLRVPAPTFQASPLFYPIFYSVLSLILILVILIRNTSLEVALRRALHLQRQR